MVVSVTNTIDVGARLTTRIKLHLTNFVQMQQVLQHLTNSKPQSQTALATCNPMAAFIFPNSLVMVRLLLILKQVLTYVYQTVPPGKWVQSMPRTLRIVS